MNESPVLLTFSEEESNIKDNSNDRDDDYCGILFDQKTFEKSTIEIASKKSKEKSASLKDKKEGISDSVQIDKLLKDNDAIYENMNGTAKRK